MKKKTKVLAKRQQLDLGDRRGVRPVTRVGGQECPPHTGWSGVGGFDRPNFVEVSWGARIKNNKRRGEWAELRFMARAAGMGFEVCRPWGDSARYDVGVEYGGRFMRVQVKSTTIKVCNSYVCNTRSDRQRRPYTVAEIDFLAAYVILCDVWYIVPARLSTVLRGNIWLAPHKKGHKYEAYMEAWELLKGE